jgi:hypothetical protein
MIVRILPVADPSRPRKRMTSMFTIELRLQARLKHLVVEFKRSIELPFVPVPWLFYHGGPGLTDSLRFIEVSWVESDRKFVVTVEDDLDAAERFGDDHAALIDDYEARGWRLLDSGPVQRVFAFVDPNTGMTDQEWDDLQRFLGESA